MLFPWMFLSSFLALNSWKLIIQLKEKKTLIWPLVTTVESSMQESSALLLREDTVNEDFRQTTVTMVM